MKTSEYVDIKQIKATVRGIVESVICECHHVPSPLDADPAPIYSACERCIRDAITRAIVADRLACEKPMRLVALAPHSLQDEYQGLYKSDRGDFEED